MLAPLEQTSNEIIFRPKWWAYEAVKDFKSDVIVATGGLGSGKTDGATFFLHDRVTRNPKSEIFWFFEPTHRKIEDAAIPKYKKHLERFGYIESVHYRITKSPHYKLTYTASGQSVHFHSFDRPDLIVATEIGGCVLDEAGDSTRTVYENISARLRDTRATIRQFLIVGAPQGVNWLAEEFDSDTLPGWDLRNERDHYHPGKKYRRFTLWTDENMNNLPPNYLEVLERVYGHNPNLIKSYRYGIFCPLQKGAAYSNYNPQRHNIEDIEPDPAREISLSFDFNAMPVSWVAFQLIPFEEGYTRVNRYVLIHESETSPEQLRDAVIEFALKHPVDKFSNTLIRIFGDSSGHAKSHKSDGTDYSNVKKYLEILGYKNVEIEAARSNPIEVDSVEAVQRVLDDNLLYICKRNKETVRSLTATTWAEGKRKLNKPPGENWTHKGDAIKYFIYQAARGFDGKVTKGALGINY